MNYRLLFLSALALLPVGCSKPTPPGNVPEAFYYKGAPIDPACFLDSAAQVGDGISLSICTGKNPNQPEYKEDHFYGVEIGDKGASSPAYSYYRYLGKVSGDHIVQTLSSAGGAAQYSTLRVMNLDGNLLRTVKRYASGDRCSGGIVSASVSGSTVTYTVNITPYNVPKLTKGEEAGFANQDLDNSAGTCLGTATFENEDIKSMQLTMAPSDIPATGTAKGDCFAAVYKNTFKPNHKMDERDIENFGTDLNTKCGPLNK